MKPPNESEASYGAGFLCILTVIFFVNISQVLVGHMRINLGSADVGMAENSLDGTQVCAVVQEIGREAMPDHMGRYFFRDAGFNGKLFHYSFDRSFSHTQGFLFSSHSFWNIPANFYKQAIVHIFSRV